MLPNNSSRRAAAIMLKCHFPGSYQELAHCCVSQVMDPQDSRPVEAPAPKPVWKRVFGGKKTELPENVKGR